MDAQSRSERVAWRLAARLAITGAGLVLALVACSGGGSSATPAATPGGGNPGGATPAGGGPATLQPVAGGGPTGKPITGTSQFGEVLSSGDFAAVGISGTGNPSVNTTGCAPNCAYMVYKGVSGAGGGVELDIFEYDNAADAASDYGDQTNDQLDTADLAALGADKAQLLLQQPGNDPSISFDELRVLKGKLWFDLAIPSNAQGKAQLLALGKEVLSRTGPLL